MSVDEQWRINDRLSIANRSLKVLWIVHRPSHSRITQQQTVVCVCSGHSILNTSRTIATIALLFDLAEYNEETGTGFQGYHVAVPLELFAEKKNSHRNNVEISSQ